MTFLKRGKNALVSFFSDCLSDKKKYKALPFTQSLGGFSYVELNFIILGESVRRHSGITSRRGRSETVFNETSSSKLIESAGQRLVSRKEKRICFYSFRLVDTGVILLKCRGD